VTTVKFDVQTNESFNSVNGFMVT